MQSESAELREKLKRKLDSCVQTGRITLSSGKVTDFYFDGRLVSLEPEGAVCIAQLMLEELARLGLEAVGGPTSGADPITSSIGVLAYQQGIPLRLFYVRKESKAYGMRRRIEGPPIPPGIRAALVDDVLTTGGSLLQARDVLRQENAVEVRDAFVVVDRQEGGEERLESEGIRLHALFRRSDFLA